MQRVVHLQLETIASFSAGVDFVDTQFCRHDLGRGEAVVGRHDDPHSVPLRGDIRFHRTGLGRDQNMTDTPDFNVTTFALLLKFAWEILRAPLYVGMKGCSQAYLGDAVITACSRPRCRRRAQSSLGRCVERLAVGLVYRDRCFDHLCHRVAGDARVPDRELELHADDAAGARRRDRHGAVAAMDPTATAARVVRARQLAHRPETVAQETTAL